MQFIKAVAIGASVCASSGFTPPAVAAPATRATAIRLSCSGPIVAAARKIASREKLSLALDPKACLSFASMYGGSSKQMIAAAPSSNCAPKKAIQIYERSRGGPWGTLLEQPVCGTSVSFGPNNPWGGIMITIDGKHYDQRGAYYTPASY